MSFKMNERTNGNELHCVLSLGFKDSRHDVEMFFVPQWGKELDIYVRACVCLFRKKKTRLCDDDAFKEEDEDKEEDTSSASIFLDGRLFG